MNNEWVGSSCGKGILISMLLKSVYGCEFCRMVTPNVLPSPTERNIEDAEQKWWQDLKLWA